MTSKFWAVVPAAGIGSRMGSEIPKQYLSLLGKTVIEHSLSALLDHPSIEACVVVLGPNDDYWPRLAIAQHGRILTTIGGAERADSVVAGLRALIDIAAADDWIMVHDAARPCLSRTDITNLIDTVLENPCGAILAQPVVETVKYADEQHCIDTTLDRKRIFLAQTPQCFQHQVLLEGYIDALSAGDILTDEASVLERLAEHPQLVEGSKQNIKITHPQDLALAEFYLTHKE